MTRQWLPCIRIDRDYRLYIAHKNHNIGQFYEVNDQARLSHVKIQAMLHYSTYES